MPYPAKKTSAFLSLCIAGLLLTSCSSPPTLIEASGVVVDGQGLIIVSDDTPGTIYRYAFNKRNKENLYTNNYTRLATIPIDNVESQLLFSKSAKDLESIDMLSTGEILVLSEQSRALFSTQGLVARYPKIMTEVRGRGLEGLAINSKNQVAALWEGGYYSPSLLEQSFTQENKKAGKRSAAHKPIFCIHPFPFSLKTKVCQNGKGMGVLEVPATPDPTQVFRAPDLVWDVDDQSFIVLLSSLNAASDEFRYMWLQKFTTSGEAIGEALNLCDKGYLPAPLRFGKASNIEGLGWYEKGKSLILINDHKATATAVVISVEPWPATNNSIACDQ